MRVPKRRSSKTKPLHQLTVRITESLNQALDDYAEATGRTYRDLTETAIEKYLNGLELTAEQRQKLREITKSRG